MDKFVGIYSPRFSCDVESVGYNFHFISDDHAHGGHVLDLTSDGVEVQLDETPGFYMQLTR